MLFEKKEAKALLQTMKSDFVCQIYAIGNKEYFYYFHLHLTRCFLLLKAFMRALFRAYSQTFKCETLA